MTDDIEDAQRRLEGEREARASIEKSLRVRLSELEERLSSTEESLRSERHSVSDRAPENRRILTEQEQTIQILQANVDKLENLVCGMREGYDEKEARRDQRGRQETRYLMCLVFSCGKTNKCFAPINTQIISYFISWKIIAVYIEDKYAKLVFYLIQVLRLLSL